MPIRVKTPEKSVNRKLARGESRESLTSTDNLIAVYSLETWESKASISFDENCTHLAATAAAATAMINIQEQTRGNRSSGNGNNAAETKKTRPAATKQKAKTASTKINPPYWSVCFPPQMDEKLKIEISPSQPMQQILGAMSARYSPNAAAAATPSSRAGAGGGLDPKEDDEGNIYVLPMDQVFSDDDSSESSWTSQNAVKFNKKLRPKAADGFGSSPAADISIYTNHNRSRSRSFSPTDKRTKSTTRPRSPSLLPPLLVPSLPTTSVFSWVDWGTTPTPTATTTATTTTTTTARASSPTPASAPTNNHNNHANNNNNTATPTGATATATTTTSDAGAGGDSFDDEHRAPKDSPTGSQENPPSSEQREQVEASETTTTTARSPSPSSELENFRQEMQCLLRTNSKTLSSGTSIPPSAFHKSSGLELTRIASFKMEELSRKQQQQQQQQQTSSGAGGGGGGGHRGLAPSPSMTPTTNRRKPKSVRFTDPLVTSLQYRPRTRPEDIGMLFFDEDELEILEEDRETTSRDQFEMIAQELSENRLRISIAYQNRWREKRHSSSSHHSPSAASSPSSGHHHHSGHHNHNGHHDHNDHNKSSPSALTTPPPSFGAAWTNTGFLVKSSQSGA